MNILINTLSISGDKGGVKTYLTNISRALAIQYDNTHFILLCSKSSYPVFEFLEKEQNVTLFLIPVSSGNSLIRIVLDQFLIPLVVFFKFRNLANVLITPSSIATLFSPIPQVLIIHAALALKNIRSELPAEFLTDLSVGHKIYYDALLPISLLQSDTVITVSGYLKNKIAALNSDLKEKTLVVYEGVDANGFAKKEEWTDPDELYVLFVSTLFTYKNADRLIKAFGKLAKNKEIPVHCRLKIIGKDPSGGEELQRLNKISEENGIKDRVDFPGYVDHNKISAYYRNAHVFVYPSSVETFGLPPLEAMASGVPVVSSNRMSLPEVVGDAGLVVDPDDIDLLANSIKRLFDDQELRNELINKGYERVSGFTWEKAADSIYAECKKIIA